MRRDNEKVFPFIIIILALQMFLAWAAETPVRWEFLTREEIRSRIGGGAQTIFLVGGSIEQHGPHLPVVTDTAVGVAVSEKAAEVLGNVLVAPPIAVGLSPEHRHFPGTLYISPELFLEIVKEYVENFVRNGMKNIVLISSHFGDSDPMRLMVPPLNEKYAERGVLVYFAEKYHSTYARRRDEILKQRGIDLKGVYSAHAGLDETADMLYLMRERVDREKIELGKTTPPQQYEIPLVYQKGWEFLSKNGILGDPRPATAELGRLFIEAEGQALADEVRDFLAHAR